MRLTFLLLFILATPFTLICQSWDDADIWEVEETYRLVEVTPGTMGRNLFGYYEEISDILVPTIIEAGIYRVELREVSSDLYEIRGTKFHLKLKHSHLNKYSLTKFGVTILFDNTTPTYISKGKLIVKSTF